MSRAFLRELDDWKLRDEDKDIRGKILKRPDGKEVGRVRDLVANTESKRVEAVVLDRGEEYPVRDVEIRGNEVILNPQRTAAAGRAPVTDRPAETNRPAEYDAGHARDETIRIPVVEEIVEVGKRTVADGGVRVSTDVKEEPIDKNVKLRKTEVHVDRHKVDRPATEADMKASRRGYETVETNEEPEVRKSARVVEEVAIKKDVQERDETVHDKTRRTEVHVEDARSKEREERKR